MSSYAGKIYRLFCCVANHTHYGDVFGQVWMTLCGLPHAVDAGREFAWRQHKQHDTQHGNWTPEEFGDEEIVPKRAATSVAWTWFEYERSDTDWKPHFMTLLLYKLDRSPQQSQTPLACYTTAAKIRSNSTKKVYEWEPQKHSRVLKTTSDSYVKEISLSMWPFIGWMYRKCAINSDIVSLSGY